MNKSELFFAALLVPADFLMIIAAAATAFWLRFTPGIIEIKPVLFQFSFLSYIKIILLVTPFFLIIFALEGLYSLKTTRTFWREFLQISFSISVGMTLVILAIFLQREWFSSRFIILSAWALSIIFISLSRFAVNMTQKILLIYKGIGMHRLALIGKSGYCSTVCHKFKQNPGLGYKIISQESVISIDSLRKINKEKGIDEILVCDPDVKMNELRSLSDFCYRNRIELKFVPAILQSVSTNFEVKTLFDEPVIAIKNTPLDGWGKIAKRIFDIIGSFFGIVITSPILLITAIAIKLDSRGPIIFKNERVGHEGNFNVYKFRYFKLQYCTGPQNPTWERALELEKKLIETQSVRKGPLYKIKNDPRKTRVGRIIEALSIDELPQLFNVLKGDMGLV